MQDQGQKQQFEGRLSKNLIHETHVDILSWVGVFRIRYLQEKHVPLLNKIRLQVKHLLKVDSLEIIWSNSFLLLTLKKFLRKSFLVRNIYCTCSGTGLLHFLTKVISLESNRSSMILHVTRKNEKKTTSDRDFLKLLKKNFS